MKKNVLKKYEIKSIIDKLKYIDFDLIGTINGNLRELKNEKVELESKIKKLRNRKMTDNQNTIEKVTEKNILSIIHNSFKIFNNYGLKTKETLQNFL